MLTIGVFTLLGVNTLFFAYGYVYEKSYLFQKVIELLSHEKNIAQEFISSQNQVLSSQNQVLSSQNSYTTTARTGDITLISPQDGEVYCF